MSRPVLFLDTSFLSHLAQTVGYDAQMALSRLSAEFDIHLTDQVRTELLAGNLNNDYVRNWVQNTENFTSDPNPYVDSMLADGAVKSVGGNAGELSIVEAARNYGGE